MVREIISLLPEKIKKSKVAKPARFLWKEYLWYLENKKNNNKLKELMLSFPDIDDFLNYLEKINYHKIIQYHKKPADGQRYDLEALFKNLAIGFKGTSFLDLGPGYGYALDIAKERGARKTEFVDHDIYVATFNILKGFRGYLLDYIAGKGLTPLFSKKYDIILSKGSINADLFNRKETGIIPFDKWICQVEKLVTRQGQIIICPTFDKGTKMCGNSYYVCEDPEAFRRSYFSTTLLERGYKILFIEGFNYPKERFPFTFYKKL